MEEKELQQPMNSGEKFLQIFFKEGPICNIILQHPRLKTKTVMKRKGKAPIEEQAKKSIKKKTMSKAKES